MCQGDTSHDRPKSAMFLMINRQPLPELRLMAGGLAGHGTLVMSYPASLGGGRATVLHLRNAHRAKLGRSRWSMPRLGPCPARSGGDPVHRPGRGQRRRRAGDGGASSSRAVRGRCRGWEITALVALHEVLIEPNMAEAGGARGDTSLDPRNSAMFLAIAAPPLSGVRLMTGRVAGGLARS